MLVVPDIPPTSSVLWPRLALSCLLATAIAFPYAYQPFLDGLYAYLLESSIYQASTFETIWTVISYAFAEGSYIYKFLYYPRSRLAVQKDINKIEKLPNLRQPYERFREAIIYVTPLLLMDLLMIKKFAGVPVRAIAISGNYDPDTVAMRGNFLAPSLHRFSINSPLQVRRALPPLAPTSRQLVVQLALSIFIYDGLFFLFHLALHKVPLLKRYHNMHHQHGEINPQITNQLDIVERLGLVLLANFSLNIIGSHVLTRTLFVPIFVFLLVDIHSGIDLPWGYDKILPEGWAAGSKRHSYHHQHGSKYYEPFFNWWDNAFAWYMGRP